MAVVYILYSHHLNKFYTDSCNDLYQRVDQHLSKFFGPAFTAEAKDWIIYFQIDGLAYKQARRIELHIKKMKSKKYIENLKKYPELAEKLIQLYR